MSLWWNWRVVGGFMVELEGCWRVYGGIGGLLEGLGPTTTSEERTFFRNCFFDSTSRSQTF